MPRGVARAPKMPAPVKEQHLGVKVPHATVYGLDRMARRWGVSRSEAVRRLLEEAVRREDQT
mgnify:CR=1 FL=1